jgi:hypothetical protein
MLQPIDDGFMKCCRAATRRCIAATGGAARSPPRAVRPPREPHARPYAHGPVDARPPVPARAPRPRCRAWRCRCRLRRAGRRRGAALSGRQQAVLEVASDADVEFGFVADMDVDSRGWMYVADAMGQVVVLDPEGRLERRIGSYGRGPGEFEAIRNLQVVEGDSLFVFDLAQARGTVFPPERSGRRTRRAWRPEACVRTRCGGSVGTGEWWRSSALCTGRETGGRQIRRARRWYGC